jgi:hypothetical protein
MDGVLIVFVDLLPEEVLFDQQIFRPRRDALLRCKQQGSVVAFKDLIMDAELERRRKLEGSKVATQFNTRKRQIVLTRFNARKRRIVLKVSTEAHGSSSSFWT